MSRRRLLAACWVPVKLQKSNKIRLVPKSLGRFANAEVQEKLSPLWGRAARHQTEARGTQLDSGCIQPCCKVTIFSCAPYVWSVSDDVLILCKPIRCSRSRVVVGVHNFESRGGNLPLGMGMARRSLFGKGARTPYKLVTGTQKPCGKLPASPCKLLLRFKSRAGKPPAPLKNPS